MNKEKLGQEPTFPLDGMYASDAIKSNNTGMSKRFYAACAAMQGLLSNNDYLARKLSNYNNILHIDNIISDSYKLSDELLKQENE